VAFVIIDGDRPSVDDFFLETTVESPRLGMAVMLDDSSSEREFTDSSSSNLLVLLETAAVKLLLRLSRADAIIHDAPLCGRTEHNTITKRGKKSFFYYK